MQNDVEWRYFLESLWRYEYVQKRSDLTDELAQTLYYESQGITDLAIRLYFFAQRYAIVRGEECITRETIQTAARMGLHSVQRFLRDIRDNDTKKIKAHGDQPFSDIERDFQQAESELMKRIDVSSSLSPGTAAIYGSQAQNGATQQSPAETSESQNEVSNITTSPPPQQRTGETLPQIADQGLKKLKISAYEALKQAGLTFHAIEHLAEESLS